MATPSRASDTQRIPVVRIKTRDPIDARADRPFFLPSLAPASRSPDPHTTCTRNHALRSLRAQEAKSDLVNVLSSLEAHWHVLEAEVVEINRDIDYCEQCLRKYGEWFNSPLQYLRVR